MTPQLRLTDDTDPASTDPASADWALDPAVRDRGQAGLKQARAALRSARPINYRSRPDARDLIRTPGTQVPDQEFDAA